MPENYLEYLRPGARRWCTKPESGGYGDRAIVAVTTHGGAVADTATVEATVIEAAVAVAGLIAETTADNDEVDSAGVQEVVADKGYHNNDVAVAFDALALRTYIAEPERGARNWEGNAAEKEVVYANRRTSWENGASGCNDNPGRKSNATSPISSIPAAWTDFMSGASKMFTRSCSYRQLPVISHWFCGLFTEPASSERRMIV